MARLAKQNEELSKEVGRFRLLEEQRAKVTAPSPAAPQVATGEPLPPRPQRKCFNCDLPGHFARECPQEKRPKRGGTDRVGGTSTASRSCSKRNQTLPDASYQREVTEVST